MEDEFGLDEGEEKSLSERLRGYVGKNKLQAGLVVVGVVLLTIGIGAVLVGQKGRQDSVEIISSDEGTSESIEIVVDVEGAVERPGVYRLPLDSRVGDALTAAGGLAETADRIWLKRFVNLAQKVPDGVKVYIPAEGEAHSDAKSSTSQSSIINDQGSVAGVSNGDDSGVVIGLGGEVSGKVNINSATQKELEALWGIGPKRAEAIISNRPYNSIEEIKSKAGVPSNVFDRIKEEIGAW